MGPSPAAPHPYGESERPHLLQAPSQGGLRLHSANHGAPLVSGRVRRCRSHALAIPVHAAYMETQAQRRWLWVMILGRRPCGGLWPTVAKRLGPCGLRTTDSTGPVSLSLWQLGTWPLHTGRGQITLRMALGTPRPSLRRGWSHWRRLCGMVILVWQAPPGTATA